MSRTQQRGEETASDRAPAIWRISAWLAGLFLWVFVVASLLGYEPADPPGHAVSPRNDPVANWCGPVGAAVAHYAYSLLGLGVWLIVAGLGAGLAATAFRRRISHAAVRLIGLVMIAQAFSGFRALLAPNAGPLPEGAGGLVAIAGAAELTERFDTLGSALWLTLLAAVGATVAFDRYLLLVPSAIWRALSPALGATWRTSRSAAQRQIAARAEKRRVRLNDVDDDQSLPKPGKATQAARSAPTTAASKEKSKDKTTTASADGSAPTTTGETDEQDETLPGAPQVFDPDSIREKVAKLPVRFAADGRGHSTDDHLRDLQSNVDLENYRFPGLDLLEDPEESFTEQMEAHVRKQAEALEEALRVYRIDGEVVSIDSGPVITLYEVRLAPGTKVSQLTSVSSDIARALKATNIRIVPNMAGRDTVGVEVPNIKKEKVRLKELMTHPDHASRIGKMSLPMFLGKDASGEPLIEDLGQMPHSLIAGTTGSGKSICLSTVITSFLYTKRPDELKLVLIDPKMVELGAFRDIPHLMCPVVTEMSKAAAIIEWAVTKMDERYELLSEAGVRDIAAYNKLDWGELRERFNPQSEQEEARIPRKLPYIVFIIDELADLMMTHKEVEGSIVRVAQKARAVGIHLVLATQRPQANVVTGLIKSNMPGRICFKVASGMDSRIVLDQKGGELLLGEGDMLFLSPRSHKLMRAQGTLVDDGETRRVVRFLKDVASPSFERQLVQLKSKDAEEQERDGLEAANEDPLFEKAVEIVLETRRGSVSLLQRRLAIGYTRASRLIDLMGEAGIIGEYKGTVAREVMISPEEWEAMKAQIAQDAAQRPPSQGELFPEGESESAETPAATVEERADEAQADLGEEDQAEEEEDAEEDDAEAEYEDEAEGAEEDEDDDEEEWDEDDDEWEDEEPGDDEDWEWEDEEEDDEEDWEDEEEEEEDEQPPISEESEQPSDKPEVRVKPTGRAERRGA